LHFFIFLQFSTEFTRFSKSHTLFENQTSLKPLELSNTSQICPQLGPLGRLPAVLAGFRRGGGWGRWGEGKGGSATHLAVDLHRFHRSGTPAASARRSPAAVAAAASNPAKGRCVPSNDRVRGHGWMRGRVSGCCHGAGNEPRRRLDCGL
jgi:hypothetical protein